MKSEVLESKICNHILYIVHMQCKHNILTNNIFLLQWDRNMKQDANTLKQVEDKQATSKLIYTKQQAWKGYMSEKCDFQSKYRGTYVYSNLHRQERKKEGHLFAKLK